MTRRPKTINPATVLSGDFIELHETSDAGVETITRARIDTIIRNGTYRVFKSRGQIVYTTDAMRKETRTCYLIDAAPIKQEPMF